MVINGTHHVSTWVRFRLVWSIFLVNSSLDNILFHLCEFNSQRPYITKKDQKKLCFFLCVLNYSYIAYMSINLTHHSIEYFNTSKNEVKSKLYQKRTTVTVCIIDFVFKLPLVFPFLKMTVLILNISIIEYCKWLIQVNSCQCLQVVGLCQTFR